MKHVADIRVSNVDKKRVEGQLAVRLCNYTDVYYRSTITPDQEFMDATATPEQVESLRLRAGDVIITKDSETPEDIGVPAFVGATAPDLVCGYHLALLRPARGQIHPRFFFWSMRSRAVRAQLAITSTGVTRFGLRRDAIGAARINVPSLDDQRRIADFLDASTHRLDQLVRTKSRLLELLDEKLAATLERLIDQHAAELWPLKHLVDPTRPIMYGIVLPGPSVEDGVLLVKGGDVERGLLQQTPLARVAPEIEASYARSRLRGGDLLISIRGSFGAVAEVPSSLAGANITQDSARVSPGRAINGRYLLYALKSPSLRRQLGAVVTGATVRGINIRDLKQLRVPVPAARRQREIASELDDLTHQLGRLRTTLSRQLGVIAEHREALVTAAVTGQLDPTSYRALTT